MNKKSKINTSINFHSPTEKYLDLFHCSECGFHSKVLSKIWIEGDYDNCIIRLLQIHPQYVEIVEILGEAFKKDGKICEELICGICGKSGCKKPLSYSELRLFGVDPEIKLKKTKETDQIKANQTKKREPLKKVLKKIKNKLLKIKSFIENEID